MKKLIYIFLIGCLLFSCKDPYGDEIYSVAEQNPISLSLKNGVLSEDGEVVLDKDDFTLWVEILERADLYDALNLSGTYTCFVPNNEGVRSFLDEKRLVFCRRYDPRVCYNDCGISYHSIILVVKFLFS